MVTKKVLNWLNDATDITLIGVGIAALGVGIRNVSEEKGNSVVVDLFRSFAKTNSLITGLLSFVVLTLVAKLVIKAYKIYISTTVDVKAGIR